MPRGRRVGDVTSRPRASNRRNGSVPEEAEPADLLAADDALEQERRGRPLDPAEGRDGSQAVAGQLAVDRDARRPGRPSARSPRTRGDGWLMTDQVRDRALRCGSADAMDISSRPLAGQAGKRSGSRRATWRRARSPPSHEGQFGNDYGRLAGALAAGPASGLLDTPEGAITMRFTISLLDDLDDRAVRT